jgi:glutamate carboxypeptidase
MNPSPLPCAADLPGMLDFLKRLVAVNIQGVNAVANIIASQFAPLGFSAKRIPTARAGFGDHLFLNSDLRDDLPTIALIAHLDTVYPAEEELRNDFAWRVEGNRIHGPGTNDIKGGTAMIWMLLTAMHREWPTVFLAINWVVALNSCEEVDSEDFGMACRGQFPKGKTACLLFEADGGTPQAFRVVRQRKGRGTFRILTMGRGAHAGAQHARGANAIVELATIVSKSHALTDYQAGVTVNIGSIHGGTVDNRVPHEATASLEMRAWSSAPYQAAESTILSFAGEGTIRSAGGYPCSTTVEVVHTTAPWPENSHTQKLVNIWESAGKSLSIPVESEARGGLSDGNVLWQYFPTIDGLGPCGDFSHCSERSADGSKEQEWVDAASFVSKTQLNAAAIAVLAEEPNRWMTSGNLDRP